MQTTEQWLDEKIFEYRKDPTGTLLDMLERINDVATQYLNSPSLATKGVLESAIRHHELFMKKILS